MFNYHCYLLSRMPDNDLNANLVGIGSARVGKSTAFFQIARRYYSARLKIPIHKVDKLLAGNGFVRNNIIYDNKKGLKSLQNMKAEFIWTDENYLTGDRRNALAKAQIKLTAFQNIFASNNNIQGSLIQNYVDLERRIINNANIMYIFYERGKFMLFAKPRNFPIVSDTYDFEKFQKNLNLLSDVDTALWHFRRLKSYICDCSFESLDDNLLFKQYLKIKKSMQIGLK